MRELTSYLPAKFYANSPEAIAIQQAVQPELELAWQGRDDLLLQLDPHTATWGLNYWEEALGLSTNETLALALRRARIIGRLRGLGTTTKAKVKEVVETFCPGCEVEVVEHFSQYLVEICLTITDQTVEDNPGLEDQLHLMMPAHLAWGFSITIETEGGILFGICSEMAGSVEVWPRRVTEIESTNEIATTGALVFHGTIEVFPEGGISNG